VAQRPPRSRPSKQRCQPPVPPLEPRPASTWASRGPPQSRQISLDSPPPLRMPCERCVGDMQTNKISKAFSSVHASAKISCKHHGSAFKISGPHRPFLVSERWCKPRLIVGPHVARLSVPSSILFRFVRPMRELSRMGSALDRPHFRSRMGHA